MEKRIERTDLQPQLNLSDLPPEIWLRVAEYLSPSELRSLSETNRTGSDVARKTARTAVFTDELVLIKNEAVKDAWPTLGQYVYLGDVTKNTPLQPTWDFWKKLYRHCVVCDQYPPSLIEKKKMFLHLHEVFTNSFALNRTDPLVLFERLGFFFDSLARNMQSDIEAAARTPKDAVVMIEKMEKICGEVDGICNVLRRKPTPESIRRLGKRNLIPAIDEAARKNDWYDTEEGKIFKLEVDRLTTFH